MGVPAVLFCLSPCIYLVIFKRLTEGQTHQTSKYRSQNQEVEQAFEPRRGSTLLEQPPDFAELSTKRLMRLPWIAIFALL